MEYRVGAIKRGVSERWRTLVEGGWSTAVCAVVDVLMTYLEKYPEHPSLKKWVKRIGDVARKMGNCDRDSELLVSQLHFSK